MQSSLVLALAVLTAALVFPAIRILGDLSPVRRLERLSALKVEGFTQADLDRLDAHRSSLLDRAVTGGVAVTLAGLTRLGALLAAVVIPLALVTIGATLVVAQHYVAGVVVWMIGIVLGVLALVVAYLQPAMPPRRPRTPKPAKPADDSEPAAVATTGPVTGTDPTSTSSTSTSPSGTTATGANPTQKLPTLPPKK